MEQKDRSHETTTGDHIMARYQQVERRIVNDDLAKELAQEFDKRGMVDASALAGRDTVSCGLSLVSDLITCQKFERAFGGKIRTTGKNKYQWRVFGAQADYATRVLREFTQEGDVQGMLISLEMLRETLIGGRVSADIILARGAILAQLDKLKKDLLYNRKVGITSPLPPTLEQIKQQWEEKNDPKLDTVEDWFGEGAVLAEEESVPSTQRQTSNNDDEYWKWMEGTEERKAAGTHEFRGGPGNPTEPEPVGRDPFELMEQLKHRKDLSQGNE
jgi:hypothetical protein